ncbi:MAG: porphobilinogen synthase, partial [Clostridiales bacterium]
MELIQRPRRLRSDKIIRELVRETRISKKSLIYPLFVREGKGINEEISALAGQRRYSPDTLPFALEKAARAGVDKLLLFGLPNEKDPVGSGAYAADGIVQQALQEAKRTFPQMQ